MHRRPRRILAAVLVIAGAAVMLLAPDRPVGIALLVAAVALEFIGITLDRRR